MTDAELTGFTSTFNDLRRVFPLRGEDHELRQVCGSYFKAFRRYPLAAIHAGAEVWMQKGTRFPKPAEWISSIPPRVSRPALETLSVEATMQHLRAERLRYEDEKCGCRACEAAGVVDQPVRYVPEVEADGRDKQALIGDRVVVVGHWAHGDELARWHVAKKAYWLAMFERFGADSPTKRVRLKRTFEQRMAEVYREPERTA